MEFKVGQKVIFKDKKVGVISKLHKSASSGEIMCIDIKTEPETELEKLFSNQASAKATTKELDWNGTSWVANSVYYKNLKERF